MACDAAETQVRESEPTVTLDYGRVGLVLASVTERFGVPLRRLMARDRSHADIVCARWTAFVVLRWMGYSLPEIGMLMGGRNHTTVHHAIRKVCESDDPRVLNAARAIAFRFGVGAPE